MAQGSTEKERLAAKLSRKHYSGLPTEPYLVELSLTFDGTEGRFEFKSSIEVPTYEAGLGILREVSAYVSNIASRVQSNGN